MQTRVVRSGGGSRRLGLLGTATFAAIALVATACTPAGADGSGDGSVPPGGDGTIVASADCPIGTTSEADADGDGVLDADELAGWAVIVTDGSGVGAARTVASSPTNTDSDGDGRCDDAERLDGTDPTLADTDGDGLDDRAELVTWGSSPLAVDTDGDARGNPRLFDGSEATELGTSPTLADTDGDAIDDYVEVIERGDPFDPLIANVPQMELTLAGQTAITLDAVRTEDSTRVETIETGLVQSTERTTSSTDTQTLKVWDETTNTVGVEAEAAFPKAFSVKGSYQFAATNGYSNEQQRSFTESSTQASQQRYDRALELSRSEGVQLNGGTLAIGLQIRNVGDVSFELTDLSVTVLRRRSDDPTAFTTVQTLTLALDRSVVLAPGQTSSVLRASGEIPVDVALDLMRDPSSLSFESSFDLTNREGHSFSFLAENTNSQTALMTIDFGNGTVLRPRVATNVRRVDGVTEGVTVADTMALLGLSHTTTPDGSGVAVLTGIVDPETGESVATDQGGAGFWAVIGSDGVEMTSTTAFDDIVLTAGETLTIMFVQDRDGDGLYLRQETRYGTSDDLPDTDGDGIGDLEEITQGWLVDADVAPYPATVLSDPTAVDRDGDGLDDPTERDLGTDPNSRDTDGDGFCDGDGVADCIADPAPLVAAINEPPLATLSLAATDGLTVTVEVVATDEDFGDEITSVLLDWGDGTIEELEPGTSSPRHRYAAGGTFTAALAVEDAFGNRSDESLIVNVEPKIVGVELRITIERMTIGKSCEDIFSGDPDIYGRVTVNTAVMFDRPKGGPAEVAENANVPLKTTTFSTIDYFDDTTAAFVISGSIWDSNNNTFYKDEGMGKWSSVKVSSTGRGSVKGKKGSCSNATIYYVVDKIRDVTELD